MEPEAILVYIVVSQKVAPARLRACEVPLGRPTLHPPLRTPGRQQTLKLGALPTLTVTRFPRLAWTICLLGLLAEPLPAQTATMTSAVSVTTRQYETRTELESAARAAESQKRSAEAWLLRSRLEKGDFQEGDRIVIALETSSRADTVQIRAGKLIQLAGMSDLSLEGVLRSELTDTLRQHLAKYLRNPGVRATPLLPLAVLGSVVAPGYYYTAADVVLRDVIMRAGGPRPEADLNKVVIRRGGETIWSSSDVRVALTDGLSLDRLHLRAGDEVFVPERRRPQLANLTAIFSSVVALTLAVIQLSR